MAYWGLSVLSSGQSLSDALTFGDQVAVPLSGSLPTPPLAGEILIIPGTSSGGSLSFSSAVAPSATQGNDGRITVNLVDQSIEGDTTPPPACPIFSPHDYLQLVRFKQTADAAGVGGPTIIVNNPPGDPMPSSFGFGIPVEADDYFRSHSSAE